MAAGHGCSVLPTAHNTAHTSEKKGHIMQAKNHLFRPLASSPNRYLSLSPSNPPSRPKPSPSLPSPSSLTCRELTSMSINLSHFNYTPGPDRPRIRRGRGGREEGKGGQSPISFRSRVAAAWIYKKKRLRPKQLWNIARRGGRPFCVFSFFFHQQSSLFLPPSPLFERDIRTLLLQSRDRTKRERKRKKGRRQRNKGRGGGI